MAALATFVLVVLVACGGLSEEPAEQEVTRVPEMSEAAAQVTKEAASGATPGASAGEEAAAAAVTVEVTSNDIFFEPKDLTIPANTDVKFVLPNVGAAAHDFSIDALGVSIDIPPGQTKEIIVNAPAGTYEFYCNVPGHKQAGMVGTLTVTEEAAAPAAEATPAGAASPEAAAPAEATPVTAATTAQEAATPVAEETTAPAEEAATPATAEAEESAAAPAAAEPIEVVSHDIYFEPKELTIPANTDVAVSLPNQGVTLHNFSIDALDISVDIEPGATEEAIINAPAGTYEFYCDIPGHKAAGMVGTLTVE